MVDFAVHGGPLRALGVRVAAASVDSIEVTETLRAGLHVRYPMYAEVDAASIVEATGASMHSGESTYLHATGFLVDPDGVIVTAVYSTGPIGRLWASEVLRKVRFEIDKRT